MDKRYFDIFRKLKEYFVSPSLNLWKRIRTQLFTSDFSDGEKLPLQEYEIQPSQQLFIEVLETIQQQQLKKKFETLSEFSVVVPEENFEKIIDLINKQKQKKALLVKMFPYKKWIAAAALVGIIATIVWVIKKDNFSLQHEVVKKTTPYQTPTKIENTEIADTVGTKLPGIEKRINKVFIASAKPLKQKVQMTKVFFDGVEIPIENNEILYSLINFKHGQSIKWKKSQQQIQLNNYSGISISPYISDVIEDLYRTKKNGKSTRKARRAANKIKSWRRADMRNFDRKRNINKNPLDIIDLGDNIY